MYRFVFTVTLQSSVALIVKVNRLCSFFLTCLVGTSTSCILHVKSKSCSRHFIMLSCTLSQFFVAYFWLTGRDVRPKQAAL